MSPSGDLAIGVFLKGNRYGVAIVPLAGGEPTWVPTDGSAPTGNAGIFRWAPDGKGVYFTTAERMNIFSYRFGAAAQTNATHFSDGVIFNGVVAPDGRTMLVTRGAVGRDA